MQTVFITGVSRGIGKALAEKFLKEGYEVIGTSTSGTADIKNKSLTILKLDLSSSKSIEQCIKEFKKLNKKIDILVNNAGIWSGEEKNIQLLDLSYLRKVLEVNLFGTIDLTEKILTLIKNGGKIINISSKEGSLNGVYNANYPDYKISKAALNMYTRILSIRVEKNEIIVASLHPGWVRTDMGGSDADIEPNVAAEEVYQRIISLKETGQFWFKQDKLPW